MPSACHTRPSFANSNAAGRGGAADPGGEIATHSRTTSRGGNFGALEEEVLHHFVRSGSGASWGRTAHTVRRTPRVDTGKEHAEKQCYVQDVPTQSTQIPGEAAGGVLFPSPTPG